MKLFDAKLYVYEFIKSWFVQVDIITALGRTLVTTTVKVLGGADCWLTVIYNNNNNNKTGIQLCIILALVLYTTQARI